MRRVEVASGLFLGDRALQQDSVANYHHQPTGKWLLALSDGIGGAGNGHLASRLIVRTAMASMKTHVGDIASGTDVAQVLHDAALAANRSVASAKARHPDFAAMGGTLLLACVSADRFHYLSIGDSLIFLLRKGKLSRLNTLHSLASNFQALADTGQLKTSSARAAAMRSTLTSAVTGEQLSKVDAPEKGVATQAGDVLMLASDGIETLSEAVIAETLRQTPRDGAAAVAANMISRIEGAAAAHQDNVSVTVVSARGS